MTFCACVPPLHEVLKLWDYFMAAGFHLGVVAAAALVIQRRAALFSAAQYARMLSGQ